MSTTPALSISITPATVATPGDSVSAAPQAPAKKITKPPMHPAAMRRQLLSNFSTDTSQLFVPQPKFSPAPAKRIAPDRVSEIAPAPVAGAGDAPSTEAAAPTAEKVEKKNPRRGSGKLEQRTLDFLALRQSRLDEIREAERLRIAQIRDAQKASEEEIDEDLEPVKVHAKATFKLSNRAQSTTRSDVVDLSKECDDINASALAAKKEE